MLLQMLPPGEWRCMNCTCKFCGIASGTSEKDDASVCVLHICNLCEKKCIHFLSFTFDVSSICLYFLAITSLLSLFLYITWVSFNKYFLFA